MKPDVCIAEHLGIFAMIYEGSKSNNQDMKAWHRYSGYFNVIALADKRLCVQCGIGMLCCRHDSG